MKHRNRRLLKVTAFVVGLCCAGTVHAEGGRDKTPKAYDELLQKSLEEKFGLEFYVNGQVIPGVVTAITDDGAVEVRNQSRDRIVIRLNRIDALGR